ncbi:MAG: alpha/beta fold hydrolase [Actinobacteria bacterium]|nr:alpha/beta fold hydrolase [Actinomycetota bacterium]
MELQDVDGAPIAWRERGEGETVLFLHGLGMTRTGWDAVMQPLAQDYRCVAWDMPGYGASSPLEDFSLEAAADAAASLVAECGGTAHVVGLSMGGMVALQLALRHPDVVRSLVLVDTSPAFGLDGTDPDEWQAARLAPLLAGAQIEVFAEPVLRRVMAPDPDPAAVALAVQSMLRVPIAGLMQTIAALPAHDVRARLREISAPTLVLVGELDEETPLAYAQALAEGIAGAELHVIPAAGHLTPFEAPLAVAALIGDHLQGMESH